MLVKDAFTRHCGAFPLNYDDKGNRYQYEKERNVMNLVEQIESEKAAARRLVEKGGSNGEKLSAEEFAELKKHYEKAKELKARYDMFKGFGELNITEEQAVSSTSPTDAHLSLRSLANDIPAHVQRYSEQFGVKGLLQSGRTLLPIPVTNSSKPLATAASEIPPRLVEYLPVVARDAPVYDVIREVDVADSGNAAVVPAYTEKPVKKIGLARETHSLKILAVLSDEIDKFVLEDATAIRQWLGTRLALEVINALESEILHGDGSETHLLGLDHVSGVQTQEWNSNILDTIILGINRVESIGVTAHLIALSTADWMTAQMRKDANGQYYMSPSIIDPTNRTMWGYQVVQVPGLTKGTGWIIGADTLAISTDRQLRVEWDTYTGFSRNTVRARVEGRYSLDVFRPHGLVKLNLTEATGK